MTFRDYNLTGPANAQAIASGLVTEDWYRTPIDRKVMKYSYAHPLFWAPFVVVGDGGTLW